MLLFALGFIAGLVVAVLVVVTLTFLRRVIEKRITVVQKAIENKGPRPKGIIVEPTSEADEAREEIINKNNQMGKDTPISELQ